MPRALSKFFQENIKLPTNLNNHTQTDKNKTNNKDLQNKMTKNNAHVSCNTQ